MTRWSESFAIEKVELYLLLGVTFYPTMALGPTGIYDLSPHFDVSYFNLASLSVSIVSAFPSIGKDRHQYH